MSKLETSVEVKDVVQFNPKHITVCFDGSVHSIKALGLAISLATRYGSHITVTHVIPLPISGYGLGESYVDWDKFERNAKEQITKQLQPYVEEAGLLKIDMSVKYLGGTISVADALLSDSEKENTDLIVMGSRGMGGFKSLLIGSVSQEIIAHSKVPVLVMR